MRVEKKRGEKMKNNNIIFQILKVETNRDLKSNY